MSFRVEVLEDNRIEITRPREDRKTQFPRYTSPDAAMIVIKFLIKKDLEIVRGKKFVPQIQKEARKAFKQLQEKSPYGKKG